MDRLFSLGVFIFTFTGGEPTLREDLLELLTYAQKKGAVTGLITNGRRLSDPEYVQRLVEAGLDFVQITVESHKPKIHDRITGVKGSWKETIQAIGNILPTPIYLTTNTTLNRFNAESFLETIPFMKALGAERFACNGLIYSGKGPGVCEEFALPVQQLGVLLPRIRKKAEELNMKFFWYTPTQYCELNPVSLGLGIKSCTAARINICIGPDGTVYPCQSYFESLGNILIDPWEKIWKSPLAVSLRNREYLPSKCMDCP
jgi:MoaA/NifB/PqqE/SkfB family radical SAM enzyme